MILFQVIFRLRCLAIAAVLVLFTLSIGANADEVAKEDGPEEKGETASDSHPLDQTPMFGGGKLPKKLQSANRKMVRDAYKTGISLTKSSNHAVDRGWEALNDDDMSTAIRRFNQGWLLDRRNGAVYWGFGIVLYQRDGDVKGALKMLRRARRLQPENPYLLVDYGRVLEENNNSVDAINLFLDAVSMDANTKYAYVGLVRSYLKNHDLENALLYAAEGKDRGDPISDDLINALEDLSKNGGALSADLKLPAAPEWAP